MGCGDEAGFGSPIWVLSASGHDRLGAQLHDHRRVPLAKVNLRISALRSVAHSFRTSLNFTDSTRSKRNAYRSLDSRSTNETQARLIRARLILKRVANSKTLFVVPSFPDDSRTSLCTFRARHVGPRVSKSIISSLLVVYLQRVQALLPSFTLQRSRPIFIFIHDSLVSLDDAFQATGSSRLFLSSVFNNSNIFPDNSLFRVDIYIRSLHQSIDQQSFVSRRQRSYNISK